MTDDLRTNATPVTEQIAMMREAGLPFDLVVEMFTDWFALQHILTAKLLVGEITPDHLSAEDKLGLITLSYFHPELIGISLNKEEEE